jgi:hypothetical protein
LLVRIQPPTVSSFVTSYRSELLKEVGLHAIAFA